MTRILGLFSAVLLTIAATQAQEKPATKPMDETAATLIANERSLLTAVAAGDKASFQSLTLPDGAWAARIGFIPLGLLADHLDDFKLTRWEIVNPRVSQLDADSALVLYAWTGAGTFHNLPVSETTLASTVWTRRNGKWLAAHHQETELTK